MNESKQSRPSKAASETSQLVETIAFQLRLAQAASFQAFSDRAADPGLRPGRYAILQFIADQPGIGQTGLSLAVGRDKTTLTPTLADLEHRGLIVREADPNDRRARCLSLTAAGKDMLDRLAGHANAHDQQIDAILGSERDELLRLLNRLTIGLATENFNGD